jgi:FkbM family methyltransferase
MPNAAPNLSPLSAQLQLARAIVRYYPFKRGKWRLTDLMTRLVTIPEQATFAFDYGVFVDTSLAEWPNGYRELFLYGSMEPSELAIWRRILRPGDAVIDGGANYGYWTLVASKFVGPTGRVFSFEANPPTAARLETNVAASSVKNVVVYPIGLAGTKGIAAINNARFNAIGGHASLRRHAAWMWDDSTEIRTTTVDAISNQEKWPQIRLIKLDIEGSELSALQGMRQVIERDRPYLTVEWNAASAGAFGYHPREVVALLQSLPCIGVRTESCTSKNTMHWPTRQASSSCLC